VLPGSYQVKLTVDGQSSNQRVVIKKDPRSHATERQLAEQFRFGQEVYETTIASRKAVSEVKSLQKELDDLQAQALKHPELMKAVSSFTATLKRIADGDKQANQMGLDSANSAIVAVLKVVEGGDRDVPAQAVQLYQHAKQAFTSRQAEWQKLKEGDLVQLNQQLERAGITPLKMAEIEQEIEYLMTR
jgi:hypothetical protein